MWPLGGPKVASAGAGAGDDPAYGRSREVRGGEAEGAHGEEGKPEEKQGSGPSAAVAGRGAFAAFPAEEEDPSSFPFLEAVTPLRPAPLTRMRQGLGAKGRETQKGVGRGKRREHRTDCLPVPWRRVQKVTESWERGRSRGPEVRQSVVPSATGTPATNNTPSTTAVAPPRPLAGFSRPRGAEPPPTLDAGIIKGVQGVKREEGDEGEGSEGAGRGAGRVP